MGREGVSQTENHKTWCHKSINSALSHAGEEISAITIDIQLQRQTDAKYTLMSSKKHSIAEII